jgi:hypothetical protein
LRRMSFSKSFFQTIQEIPATKSHNNFPAFNSGIILLQFGKVV